MSVKIITDSAADITKEQADALGITFLSLKTIFGEEEFIDGVTMSHYEFYEKLTTSSSNPTTSQVPPADFEAAYQKIKEAGDTAVVITLASKLSGTYQSANIAREGYEDCIWVVDSENASVSERILVEYACQLQKEGKSASEIADALNQKKKDAHLIVLLDTLEYLKRGGRISGAAALAGNLLSIKPVITLVDGAVSMLGKARGTKNGSIMLRQEIEKFGIDCSLPLCLGYSGFNDNMLQKFIADSSSLWEDYSGELPISTIGSTIGTHVGPDAIFVAFFAKEN